MSLLLTVVPLDMLVLFFLNNIVGCKLVLMEVFLVNLAYNVADLLQIYLFVLQLYAFLKLHFLQTAISPIAEFRCLSSRASF